MTVRHQVPRYGVFYNGWKTRVVEMERGEYVLASEYDMLRERY